MDEDQGGSVELPERVLMVSIFDYVPMYLDELAVKAYEKVQITQTSLNEMTDFVWATKVDSQISGFIPRMLLRRDGTTWALPGFVNWTRQEADRNLKPNTYVIRDFTGYLENELFTVSIWNSEFGKCTHHDIVGIEMNGKTLYQVNCKFVDSVQQVIDGLAGSVGKVQPLSCEPPATPLRNISVNETENQKTRNLGSGHFGVVYETVKVRSDGTKFKFAAKKPREETLEAKRDMDQEIGIMKYIAYMKNKLYCHTESLVKLLFASEGFQVVFIELCPLGLVENVIEIMKNDNNGVLPLSEILEFATQLMEACEFLTRIRVSHNDWGCKNTLVASGGTRRKYLYKVCDFGKATYVRQGNEESILTLHHLTSDLKRFEDLRNRKLPIFWLSPEFYSPNFEDCDENYNIWACCVTIMEFSAGEAECVWSSFEDTKPFKKFLARMQKDPRVCDEYEYKPKPEFMSDKRFTIVKKGIRHKHHRARPLEVLYDLKGYE